MLSVYQTFTIAEGLSGSLRVSFFHGGSFRIAGTELVSISATQSELSLSGSLRSLAVFADLSVMFPFGLSRSLTIFHGLFQNCATHIWKPDLRVKCLTVVFQHLLNNCSTNTLNSIRLSMELKGIDITLMLFQKRSVFIQNRNTG